jgi:hypothetical protein
MEAAVPRRIRDVHPCSEHRDRTPRCFDRSTMCGCIDSLSHTADNTCSSVCERRRQLAGDALPISGHAPRPNDCYARRFEYRAIPNGPQLPGWVPNFEQRRRKSGVRACPSLRSRSRGTRDGGRAEHAVSYARLSRLRRAVVVRRSDAGLLHREVHNDCDPQGGATSDVMAVTCPRSLARARRPLAALATTPGEARRDRAALRR